MKVAIIGANSFIARNLIYIYQLKYPDIQLNLYDIHPNHFDNLLNYSKINITNKNECLKINFDVDIIYIFSGKTGTINGFKEYFNFISVNEISLLNILTTYINKKSNAKIIYPSTRLLYKGASKPLLETSAKEFKTIYATNKFVCENYIQMYSKYFNIKYCIFRICVPYGSIVANIQSYGIINYMLNKAKSQEDITIYGNGKYKRTVTNIIDLCDAFIIGAHSKKCINDAYNIGGESFSLYQIANTIASFYKVSVITKPFPKLDLQIESGSTVFNSTKFYKATGFKYKHKFHNIEEWSNL